MNDFFRDSQIPDAQIFRKGIAINWSAFFIIILGLLGIGGSGFSIVTNNQDPKNVSQYVDKQIKVEMGIHEEKHTKLNSTIENISSKLDTVIKNQNWQKAEQEANRICSTLPVRKQESCKTRLLKENMDRLEINHPTCTNVNCSN